MNARRHASHRGGIQIRGLRKRYGNTRALDGLDLDLRPGEVLGIAGPNGAGKSTLMRILAGEEAADAGELLLDGGNWSRADAATAVAVVHQEPQLFPNLSVAENLMVGREGGGVLRPRLGRHDRELMEALGIAPSGRAAPRQLHAGHPAAHRDRPGARPRRPRLPLRRAQLGPDR